MRLFGKKIAILGTGAWGTALAMCAVHSRHKVTMWSTFPQEIDYMLNNGENKVLPGVKVPEEIKFSKDLTFVEDADICIMAVPSFAVSDLASKIAEYSSEDCTIVNIAKGFEPKTFAGCLLELKSVCRIINWSYYPAHRMQKKLPGQCLPHLFLLLKI